MKREEKAMQIYNIVEKKLNNDKMSIEEQQDKFIKEIHFDFGKKMSPYYLRLPFKNAKQEALSRKTVDFKPYREKEIPGVWFEGKFVNNLNAVRQILDVAEEDICKIDRYITVNEFGLQDGKIYRNGAYLRRRCSFFMDLDFHDIDIEEIDNSINRLLKEIKIQIIDNEILCPTVITYSGRGLGLFYVLETPVEYTNVEDMIRFKEIYQKLIQRFRNLFGNIVEVDGTITDAQRVCRIPGTYNTKAGKFAKIIGIYNTDEKAEHGIRYTLDDIDRGCKLENIIIEKKKVKNRERKKGDNPALHLDKIKQNAEKVEDIDSERQYDDTVFRHSTYKARLAMGYRYQMLIDLLPSKDSWVGYRNSYMLIMYSSLKVFLPHEIAIREAIRINKLFDVPLDDEELESIINSVDGHMEVDVKQSTHMRVDSHYRFTNEMIATMLDSYEAMEDLKVKFYIERKNPVDEKYNRDVLICKLFLEGYTYNMIEEALKKQGVKCSESTIKRVLAKVGIKKKDKGNKSIDDFDLSVLKEKKRKNRSKMTKQRVEEVERVESSK